jgi:hypothetical protein
MENTHGSPRAVGGFSPEDYVEQFHRLFEQVEDDLPDYMVCVYDGDLILRRRDKGWSQDYLIIW